ncbi:MULTISPECIES: TetR/AcrR family transcriptional regulator C-terminal domain-containing protein [unclassified Kitasatospora]|uniref:TetR/AcrR family transcriptional regulator C-terminal domain-containing protein n=1 Tax=unclassified Kitasatospora TaxID=2633591 RepID=UPI0033DDDC81
MGRPPRSLLTREGIMRAALELVDEEGADALSTTRVAARLGVKGPSLYNYVAGRDEIIQGMFELIVAEMDLDPAVRPWTTALATWARAYRATFTAHPNAMPLLAARPAQSVAALQVYANAFAMLREAGFPEDRLLTVTMALKQFVMGSTLALEGHPLGTAPADDLPPGLEPFLNPAPDFREQVFETGLALLIRGFRDELDDLRAQQPS